VLTVSSDACANIALYPAPFTVAFQIATAAAWNLAIKNSTLNILPGDVVMTGGTTGGGIVTACSPSSRRSLFGTSTVTVTDSIWTAPDTTTAQAITATAGFLAAAQQTYVNSQFGSNYGVQSVTATADAPVTVTVPTPSDSSSSSSNALALGLGIGLGVGGGLILIGVIAFVVMRRKGDQAVSPKE
jgi:hypothetical protein